ncbi:hypothetical protein HD806DRAFT_549578 [Xylariaceae sp. AK1471]|nr:hypothetical protein HD806DRAFT_549578 [Xylariaceae sp. AK1471]
MSSSANNTPMAGAASAPSQDPRVERLDAMINNLEGRQKTLLEKRDDLLRLLAPRPSSPEGDGFESETLKILEDGKLLLLPPKEDRESLMTIDSQMTELADRLKVLRRDISFHFLKEPLAVVDEELEARLKAARDDCDLQLAVVGKLLSLDAEAEDYAVQFATWCSLFPPYPCFSDGTKTVEEVEELKDELRALANLG